MYIYRNLTTGRWHLRVKPKASKARLAGECDLASVAMRDVTFRASETVAAWCLKREAESGKPTRLVHAYAVGERVAAVPQGERVRISYNHRRGAVFYRCDTGAAISHCAYVAFEADGNAYAIGAIS